MMKPSIALLLSLFMAWGCSKEQFAGSPKSETYKADAVEVFQNLSCANSTLIKPPVDILYVVDNSLSSGYLSTTVKQQLQLTIQSVSQQFDYRIIVAPLLPDGGDDSFRQVITNNASAIPSANVVSLEGLSFFATPTGNKVERGFDRAADLIDANRSSGLIRSNAHTIVVLVSNGDDTDTKTYLNGFYQVNGAAYDAAYNRFINLKASLNAHQFRFFSLVAHTQGCQTGYTFGDMYRRMSKRIYTAMLATDQGTRPHPDSYDLCGTQYAVYAGVNSSIQQETLSHTYDYWLVSANTPIDTTDIQVSKITSGGSASVVPASATNGWTYHGQASGLNTRRLPTPGEPKTGYFIKLNGSAELVTPDCLVVKTRTPTEYYGYIVIPSAPKVPQKDNVVVRINGQVVPYSTTNGWSYEGYRENQNIKVNANGSVNTMSPLNRTGYFLKLNGSSYYASGESVTVGYNPAGI